MLRERIEKEGEVEEGGWGEEEEEEEEEEDAMRSGAIDLSVFVSSFFPSSFTVSFFSSLTDCVCVNFFSSSSLSLNNFGSGGASSIGIRMLRFPVNPANPMTGARLSDIPISSGGAFRRAGGEFTNCRRSCSTARLFMPAAKT